MSGNVVRDVTIRLNIEAGNVPKFELPAAEQVKATFEAMTKGYNDVKTAAENAVSAANSIAQNVTNQNTAIADATKFIEQLAAQGKGLDELRATIDQVLQGLSQMGTSTGMTQAVSQIEKMRTELEAAAEAQKTVTTGAGAAGGAGAGTTVDPAGITDMDARMQAFAEATEAAGQRIIQMVEAGATIEQIMPAIDEMVNTLGKQAQEQLGLTTEEVQKLAEELKQNAVDGARQLGKELSAAEREANRAQAAQNRAWRGVQQGITGAAMAGARLASTLALLDTANKGTLTEIAQGFIKVQATIAGLREGQESMQHVANGLGSIATLATSAAARTTALAGANSTAAISYTYLARTATIAQAAMGPLGVVIGVTALAVTAITSYNQIFGEKAEDAAKKAEEGQKAYAEAIRKSAEDLQRQTSALEGQNRIIEEQLRLRQQGQKGHLTAAQIAQEDRFQSVENQARAKNAIKKATAEALATSDPELIDKKAAAFAERDKIKGEIERGKAQAPQLDQGSREGLMRQIKEREKRVQELDGDIAALQAKIDNNARVATIRDRFDPKNMGASVAEANKLPAEQRQPIVDAIMAAAVAEAQRIRETQATSQSQLDRYKSEGVTAKGKIDGARAGFVAEERRAAELQNPRITRDINRDLDRAFRNQNQKTRGSGIDTVLDKYAGYFEEGTLPGLKKGAATSRDDVMKALADSAVFDAEEQKKYNDIIREQQNKTTEATKKAQEDLELYLKEQEKRMTAISASLQALQQKARI